VAEGRIEETVAETPTAESDSDDAEVETADDSRDKITNAAIRAATELKEQGTTLFKEGKHAEAVAIYIKAADEMPPISGYREAVARDVKTACLTNAAMCLLKIEDYEGCIEQCLKAITVDKKCVKAYYRRGIAARKLEHFEEAREALKQASTLEPKNKAIVQELDQTNKEEMQKRKKKTGINDYSRFDNLDLSDDEEEQQKEEQRTPPPPSPEEKKKKKKQSAEKKKATAKPPPSKEAKEEEDDDDDDEIVINKAKGSSKYWWDQSGGSGGAPTSTGTITPQKIASPPEPVAAPSNQAGSVWNNGTWEEKNMLPWFKDNLSKMAAIQSPWQQGTIRIKEVKDVEGDATICVRGKKVSHLYDLSFVVSFEAEDTEGGKKFKGKLKLTIESEEPFEISLSWEGKKPASGSGTETALLAAIDSRCKSSNDEALAKKITAALHVIVSQYQELV